MPYKFISGITMADVAFKATGKTMEDMFSSAALATTNTMIKNLKSIKHNIKKSIKINAGDPEKLLFSFLSELVFLKDAKIIVFNKYDINISEKKGIYKLQCTAYGDKLDMKKQTHIVDVKAVTMHMFYVKKTKKGWECRIVLDV